jgi:hypothetical protein
MIKVNYNQKTGKVISFGKDTKPYIEITEQERRQPLPDKYSYYAVVDGKFTIKRRTPTIEELHKDDIQAINSEINELKKKLFDTDYKAIKYSEGLLTDKEYAEVKAQRQAWRDEINRLEEKLQ